MLHPIPLDLASGIGRAADSIGYGVMIFFNCIIFIQLVLVLIGFWVRSVAYRMFLRVYVIIPLGLTVFAFQHEVGHYIQGTIMLLLSIVSVVMSFRFSQ